ncbi:MAG TPA: Imm51 family immunity protein [Bacteroidia bacterium]|jgi:sensor c-di-GMP phosphodiesterase-like protein
MKDYVIKMKHEDSDNVTVCFYIEQNKVLDIGEKMNAINEQAYMNGYNWEAFLNYYLEKNYPELIEGLDGDPEAGTYVALYDNADEAKADKLVEIIENLIENEALLYEIVKNEGELVEWD